MQDWHSVAQTLHDNAGLIFVVLLVSACLMGWLVFQMMRGSETRDEMVRLRRKLADLELERMHAYSVKTAPEVSLDPSVLSARWVRKGAAATTSDGGCLLIVDDVVPPARTAVLTLRIDGVAVHVRHHLRTGHLLRAEGNLGTYTVQLTAVEPLQAMVGVSLRNRHAQAAS